MKNEDNTKEYFNTWKSMKLSETSRERIQNELRAYAEFHAVEEGVRVSERNRSMNNVPERTSFMVRLSHYKLTSMTAFILIALLLGGGTTYAAQSSLPGDALYPVKIEVNDNVRSALALSDKKQADVQTTLVKERLQEAEQLAATGKLNASVSAQLDAGVSKHYQEALKQSDIVEAHGDVTTATDVRASLSGAFHSYGRLLDNLNKSVKGNDSKSLVSSLGLYADAIAQAQAKSSTQLALNADASVNVTTAIQQASAEVSSTRNELKAQKSKLSADLYTQIDAQLGIADTYIQQARDLLSAQNFASAYTTVQSAIIRVQLAQNMLDSSVRLQSYGNVELAGLFTKPDNTESVHTTAASMMYAPSDARQQDNTENSDTMMSKGSDTVRVMTIMSKEPSTMSVATRLSTSSDDDSSTSSGVMSAKASLIAPQDNQPTLLKVGATAKAKMQTDENESENENENESESTHENTGLMHGGLEFDF